MEFLPEGIVLYAVIALATVGLSLGAWLLLKASPVSPEEREQRRRMHVSRIGRGTEARILEILGETDKEDSISLISYRYEVRGVEYEAHQDVRFYQEHIDLSQVAAGQPASVKFDPQNHANSIVLAEDWSGL